MKLTKQRLIEIIKEEYQTILNEKTVRMGDMGRMGISKMDAKVILSSIAKEFGIRV